MASGIACSADAVLFKEQGKDRRNGDELKAIRHAYSEVRDKKRVLIIKAEGVDVSTASLAEHWESTMQTETNGATLRYTILGHVVRGGRPSAMDRIWAPDWGFQTCRTRDEWTYADYGWMATLRGRDTDTRSQSVLFCIVKGFG